MISKAKISDCKEIHLLINSFAKKELMLSRSLNYVYENIRDFWVYKKNNKVIGCCALHIIGWNNLAEIKSLSVNKKDQKHGIGNTLILKCLEDAKDIGIQKVFALTYVVDFFKKLGFKIINKDTFFHKIWSDCIDVVFSKL